MTGREKLLRAIFATGATRRVLPLVWRISRGMTLGVRIAVLDGDRVLLVRHGYIPGWHFPGGAVDPGEAVQDAAIRELAEETGCTPLDQPELHGLFFNPKAGGRDHVALFVCRSFTCGAPPAPNWEIAEFAFFPRDRLPPGTTASTERRLAEICEGTAIAVHW